MTEYAFDPKDAVAKAGKVTITAPNDGQTVHELVLLKTDDDPANLPKKGTRSTRAPASARSPTWRRERQEGDVQAWAGKYAMVCALPGHYEGGMYGSLTVK